MADFNAIDITILVILSISIFTGFIRGLLREVLSLLTWIAAFIVATLFANRVAVAFFNASESSDASQTTSVLHLGISFIALFVLTLFIGWIINRIISSLANKNGMDFFDRFMGGLFGLARGFIVILAGIFLIGFTSWASNQSFQDSKLVKKCEPIIDWIDEHVQPELKSLKEKIREQGSVN